jgi:hypothetical protein
LISHGLDKPKGEERKKKPISDDANEKIRPPPWRKREGGEGLAAPWMWVRVEEGKGLVEGNGRKAW